jgi:hypothetical protein
VNEIPGDACPTCDAAYRSSHAHSFGHRSLALAAAVCALTGCAVPMQTVDASRAECASYGFQPGSEAFANCVMTEQHRHTLRIALRPTAAPVVPVPQAPELPAMVMPMQAPALQPLAQAQQPQFCFGAGVFEQCQ